MPSLNRRHFLQATAGAALGAKLGLPVLTAGAQALPARASQVVHAGPLVAPTSPTAPTAPAGANTGPYLVTATSALSQDVFVTADALLDPAADQILPYLNADGLVEAYVVSDGNLNQVVRDATQPSGWSYAAVLDANGNAVVDVDDAVVIQQGGSPPVVAAVDPAFGPYLLVDGLPYLLDTATYPADAGPLKVGYDPYGGYYLYSFNTDGTINVLSDAGPVTITSLQGLDITDGLLLWNPAYSADDPVGPQGAVLAVSSQQMASLYLQTDAGDYSLTPRITWSAESLLYLGWSPDPQSATPRMIVQDSSGVVMYTDYLGGPSPMATFGRLAPDQIAVWFEDDLFTVAALDTSAPDGTITVLAQYGTPTTGYQFTDGVTIESGALAVAGLTSDPQQGTLFVVAVDGTLSVVSKDPTLGTWSRVPICLASPDAQDLTNWRTQITVVDANAVPVPGASVVVTPDRAIGVWQPTGSSIVTPDAPATFTTNRYGQITLAVVAVDLESPQLSFQLLDATTTPAGDPLAVSANGDVMAYLAGTAPLPQLGSFSGSALVAPSPYDGQPVSSTLAGMSGTASTAVASMLSSCAAAGQAPASAPGPQSFLLDLTGPVPIFTPSDDPWDPRTQPTVPSTGSAGSWWDSVKNDVHSVEHALRNGLIKVEQCAGQFVEQAETAVKNWVLNIVVSVEGFGEDLASWVVTGVKEALTAIHGILQAIEVDVQRALTWLRNVFGNLIPDTEANAATVLGWIDQIPASANALIADLPALTDGFFLDREDAVKGDLAAVAVALGDTQFGQNGTVPQTPGPSDSSGLADVLKVLHDVTNNWLLDKILSEFSESSQQAGTDEDATTLLANLITNLLSLGTEALESIGSELWNGLSATLTSPSQIYDVAISTLLDVAQTAAVTVLEMADAAMQALIALAQYAFDQLSAFLSTSIDDVPLIGGILRLFKVDDTTSVGHLFALISMFPPTLIVSIESGGTASLFPSTTASGAVATSDPWGEGLRSTHGVVRVIEGLFDTAADLAAYDDGQADSNPTTGPLQWSCFGDAMVGLVLAVVDWPGMKNADGTTAPPFFTPLDGAGPGGNLQAPKWLLSLAGPVLFLCLHDADQAGIPAPYMAWLPWATTGLAGAVMGLGLAINDEKQAQPVDYFITAAENTPRVLAPFTTKAINESSNNVAIGVKVAADCLLETLAGALIADGQ